MHRSTRTSTCRRVRLAPLDLPGAPLTFSERPETPSTLSATIPLSRDPDFVDWGDILDQIDRLCSEPAARVALAGLDVAGTSRLPMEQTHRLRGIAIGSVE